jgi:predicted nucleotidyltransferase
VVAWSDRRHESNKDAQDLRFILSNYADAGNIDRLYEEYGAFLEANEYDTALAGSRLLGADARRVLSAETRETIGEICRTFRGEMESAMSRNRFLERGDRADELLAQFLMGLETELPISGSS